MYAWVNQTLRHLDYGRLPRVGKGPVRRYVAQMTGKSRAQTAFPPVPMMMRYPKRKAPLADRSAPAFKAHPFDEKVLRGQSADAWVFVFSSHLRRGLCEEMLYAPSIWISPSGS